MVRPITVLLSACLIGYALSEFNAPAVFNGQLAEDKYRLGTVLTTRVDSDGFASSQCTGQIVNKKWVLCAAHCLWGCLQEDDNENCIGGVGFTHTGQHIGVIPGALWSDAREWVDSGIFVKNVYVDKRYVDNDIYDITLYELDSEMPDGFTHVTFKSEPAEGTVIMAAGYGAINPADDDPSDPAKVDFQKIQQTRAKIVNMEECESDPSVEKEDNMVCTMHEDGDDGRVCFGDSGGPIYEIRGDNELYSYGTLSGGNGCGTGFPDAYAAVDTAVAIAALDAIANDGTPSTDDWLVAPGDLLDGSPKNTFPYYSLPASPSPTPSTSPPGTSSSPSVTPSTSPDLSLISPTPSNSPNPSASNSKTPTPSPSATSTVTPTPSSSSTPSPSVTPTPSTTPSVTPSPSMTPSPSPFTVSGCTEKLLKSGLSLSIEEITNSCLGKFLRDTQEGLRQAL